MRLVLPDRRYQRSYLDAVQEFYDAGEEHYGRPPSWPVEGEFPGVDFTLESLRAPVEFGRMVDFLLEQRDPDVPRPRAYIPFTELWMDEGGEFVGRISLRHELNELLFTWGGHVGYAVRPSARRRGHASSALRQLLPLCRDRDIDPVLITCDPGNAGSRAVIESAGGVYEDTRDGKQRFWINLPDDL